MKNKFLLIFLAIITFNSTALIAAKVTLKKHTMVPVRLVQNVNGGLDNQGDTIFFEVIEDIKVDGEVVISKGTFVKGKVTNAESRKSMGKAGNLAIEARTLQSVDGQTVEVIRDSMSSKGKTRTGATVATVVLFGPIGLLAKGRAASIMIDTEYEVEIKSDLEIDTSLRQAELQDDTHVTNIDIEFKKYKSKIKFSKGKIGKDFILLISLPKDTKFKASDISIIEVRGHKLPHPIYPNELNWEKKTATFSASISFVELLKYISPEPSTVKVQVAMDNKILQGETIIKTRWKLK